MTRSRRLLAEIASLRAEVAHLTSEIAELRARLPAVFIYPGPWSPCYTPPVIWDPMRPYCAPAGPPYAGTSGEPLPPWPTTVCQN
jgi:hypothetical protein